MRLGCRVAKIYGVAYINVHIVTFYRLLKMMNGKKFMQNLNLNKLKFFKKKINFFKFLKIKNKFSRLTSRKMRSLKCIKISTIDDSWRRSNEIVNLHDVHEKMSQT